MTPIWRFEWSAENGFARRVERWRAAARFTLGLSALTYTNPTVTAGKTTLKAAHVNELREGTK